MADHYRDEELSLRYRELAREEPPRALDDAILAAARREVESRPAPLVAPTGRRRWFVPVAAAAVIVLSAVVTLHVQREQPDPEMTAQQSLPSPQVPVRKDDAPAAAPPAQMREEKLASQPKEVDAQRAAAEAAKPLPERRQRQAAPAPKPAAPSQPPAGESAPALARSEPKVAAESERFSQAPAPVAAAPSPPAAATQMRPAAPAAQPAPRAADSAAGSGPAASAESRALGGLRDHKVLAKIETEPPEKILERIAALRREGRAREADDLYAEFRRRFPDYRIPDAMREQVLPR